MKKRIAHIHWSGDIGGVERWIRTIAGALDPREFDLTILLLNRGGHLLAEGEVAGANVVELGWTSGWSPRKALQLRARLKRESFDILHNHVNTWLVGWALSGQRGAKIYHEHGLLLYDPERTLRYYGMWGGIYDRFVVTNPPMAERLERNVPRSRGRTALLPNPTDTEALVPSQGSRPPRPTTIGGLGRHNEEKDWPLFLRTAARILRARDDVVFKIMGDGPLKPLLRAMIAEMGVREHVHLIEPAPDVASFYQDLDLLLFTSAEEDFGMVIPEAIACGVPVVMAPTKGGADTLFGEVSGVSTTRRRGSEELASHVLERLNSLPVARAEATEGRAVVESRFGASSVASQLSAIYRQAG